MKLSFRKHEVRTTVPRLTIAILFAVQGVSANAVFAEAGAKRFPVTTEMVMTAMQNRQLPTQGVEVRLSAPITAASDNPMLEIQSVTQINAHNAQLKMVCRNHSQCLPFYVSATWLEPPTGMTLPSASTHQVGKPQEVSNPAGPSSRGTVTPGSPATLIIEDGKVHIRLQVVCLQGGAAGDKVRVSTPDHKVAYKAEVVAPNLLKGSF